jgi:NADPH:quinone reductase-like Zn-dependent oxidoreductase
MMRRVRFDQFGDPGEVLHVVEGADPIPGPGEVVVRVSTRPVHPADLLTVLGFYGVRPELPASPGLEGAGTIAALGSEVEGLVVGERVIPVISLSEAGSWQEYVTVPSSRVLPVPEGIDDAAASQALVGPLSSWLMLTSTTHPNPGDWVIQNAASGAMGRFNREVATSLGLRIIDVVRRGEAAEELRGEGAPYVIDSSAEDVVSNVKRITGGDGVSVALDAIGGDPGAQLLQTLTAQGIHVLYGALSFQPLPLPPAQTIFDQLRVQGFWVEHWYRQTPLAVQQTVFAHVLDLLAEGKIIPRSGPSFGFDELTEALKRASASDGLSGKVLLVS